jgi:hypothetical protein
LADECFLEPGNIDLVEQTFSMTFNVLIEFILQITLFCKRLRLVGQLLEGHQLFFPLNLLDATFSLLRMKLN